MCEINEFGSLWLANCDLTVEDIDDLTACVDGVGRENVEQFALHENALTTLPEGMFDGFTALTHLGVFDNALTTLPEGIFEGLSGLVYLRLEGNPLECLPTVPSTLPEVNDDDATAFTDGLRVDPYGDECGCSILGVTDNVCGEEACTPGEFGYTCEAMPAPVPAPTEAPARETPAPTEAAALETPAPQSTPGPTSSSEGSRAPVQDWTAESCAIGSICQSNLCCHPELKTCGRKNTFCQERDLFNGVRCCSGTDGDPSELNVCAEDSICDAPEGQSTIEKTEVWLSIVASVLAIVGCFIGYKKCTD